MLPVAQHHRSIPASPEHPLPAESACLSFISHSLLAVGLLSSTRVKAPWGQVSSLHSSLFLKAWALYMVTVSAQSSLPLHAGDTLQGLGAQASSGGQCPCAVAEPRSPVNCPLHILKALQLSQEGWHVMKVHLPLN